ncbi:MAG: S41 family peptidase [Rhodanobacteraceae bacterium]
MAPRANAIPGLRSKTAWLSRLRGTTVILVAAVQVCLAFALLIGVNVVQVAHGQPIGRAPGWESASTVLDSDRRFDSGSGIVIKKLDQTQVDNLVTLGKVWGFLKYYDPAITSGQRQWDYDLFRVLPAVLAAPTRASANAVMVKWIDGLGSVPRCSPCAHLDQHDLQLRPDLDWIADTRLLGKTLSRKLQWIRDQRRPGTQFYVALAPKVGNPIFEHERSYGDIRFPDSGFQLLALYRFWNIIEYWYPDRNVIGEDWDKVLATFIPKLVLAKDRTEYQLQMMALIAEAHDTHANLWSSLAVRPPAGRCYLPVRLRFVQHQAVVTGVDGMQAKSAPLKIGDVITKLDGRPVSALVKEWTPYYADSNEAARLRDIARYMTRGPCDQVRLTVRRGSHDFKVEFERVPITGSEPAFAYHDLPGPAFRLLSPEVAYLKLSSARASQVADDITQAAGTKGLIIDARDYPSEFVVFALGSLLVDRPTPFARFTVGDLSNPGAFHWMPPQVLKPGAPHYRGKVLILVDAVTQSAAEYAAMALRAAPGALVVGSTTAGADGNVSRIPLPGGLFAMISGIGMFYPDRWPTQRVGIVPDVVAKPTIAEIRAGRDPILEEGLRLILGPKTPLATLEQMYRGLRHEHQQSGK